MVERVTAASDELLTIAEVAEEYRVAPKTVIRWVKQGEPRAIRLPGGQLRVQRGEMERCQRAWLTA